MVRRLGGFRRRSGRGGEGNIFFYRESKPYRPVCKPHVVGTNHNCNKTGCSLTDLLLSITADRFSLALNWSMTSTEYRKGTGV